MIVDCFQNNLKTCGKSDRFASRFFIMRIIGLYLLLFSTIFNAQTAVEKPVVIKGGATIYSEDSSFNKGIDEKNATKEIHLVEDSLGNKAKLWVYRARIIGDSPDGISKPSKADPKSFSKKIALKKVEKLHKIHIESPNKEINIKPASPREIIFRSAARNHLSVTTSNFSYALLNKGIPYAICDTLKLEVPAYSAIIAQFLYLSQISDRAPPYYS